MAAASKKMGKRNKEWQRGNTSTSTHVKNRGTGSSCEVTKEIKTLCRHGPPFPSHDTLLLEALWEGCPDTVTGGQQRTGSVKHTSVHPGTDEVSLSGTILAFPTCAEAWTMCAKGTASTLQGSQQPSHLPTESEAQTTAQIWGCSGTACQFLPFFSRLQIQLLWLLHF